MSQLISKYYDLSAINISENSTSSSHSLNIKSVKTGSKVLDIGCADGKVGEYLVLHKNCEVVGIDFCETALEKAKQKNCYKNLLKINLNEFENNILNEFEEYFDYILLADVLEHLIYPDKLLIKLKKHLKQNGEFLISLPNIAHGSVKLKLLKNKFEYTSYGLLDDTHLRFFTLENIILLMNSADLEIQSLERIFLDITAGEQSLEALSFPDNIKKYVSGDIESFVYQYIIKAKSAQNQLAKEKVNINYLKPNVQNHKELKAFLKKVRKPLYRRILRNCEKSFKKLFVFFKLIK